MGHFPTIPVPPVVAEYTSLARGATAPGTQPQQHASKVHVASNGQTRTDFGDKSIITDPKKKQSFLLDHAKKEVHPIPFPEPAPVQPLPVQSPAAPHPALPQFQPPKPIQVKDLGKKMLDGHEVVGKEYTFPSPVPASPTPPPLPDAKAAKEPGGLGRLMRFAAAPAAQKALGSIKPPAAPKIPGAPNPADAAKLPNVPKIPGAPEIAKMPVPPASGAAPKAPELKTPQVPDLPAAGKAPVVPPIPGAAEAAKLAHLPDVSKLAATAAARPMKMASKVQPPVPPAGALKPPAAPNLGQPPAASMPGAPKLPGPPKTPQAAPNMPQVPAPPKLPDLASVAKLAAPPDAAKFTQVPNLAGAARPQRLAAPPLKMPDATVKPPSAPALPKAPAPPAPPAAPPPMVTEIWTSTSHLIPMLTKAKGPFGEQVTKCNKAVPGEPDPKAFQIPHDYKMIEPPPAKK